MQPESNYHKRFNMDQNKKKKWDEEQNYIKSLIV